MRRLILSAVETAVLASPLTGQVPLVSTKASPAEKAPLQEPIKVATAEERVDAVDAVIQPQINDAPMFSYQSRTLRHNP